MEGSVDQNTYMLSSQDWVQSCTAISTTDSSIILEDTVWKENKLWSKSVKHTSGKQRNTQIMTESHWSGETGNASVLTRLLFHCIQDPFNDILQFRGIDGLKYFNEVPAGFTGAQWKNRHMLLSFLSFSFCCW